MKNNLCLVLVVATSLSLVIACGDRSEPVAVEPINIHVPNDYGTIQEAIVSAADGSTVTVAAGIYEESIQIEGKSNLQIIGAGMHETIINGSDNFAFSIYDSENILITDLSITNANDGVTANASIEFARVKVFDTIDGIDMEGGYLIVRDSKFFDNKDDAIDLDEYTSAIIEQNIITRSGDDGIEIRLHPQPESEEPITITIINNVITDSMSDGIQLIDYEDVTKREFIIQRNLFLNIQNAGVSFKDNAETLPTLIPGELGEKVNVSNNTFAYGKVGILANGQKLAAFNNLFINHSEGAYISATVNSFSYSAIQAEEYSESDNFISNGKLFLGECYQPSEFAVLVINQGVNSFELNGEMFRANDYLVEDEKHDIGFWEFNANSQISCELINN